MYTFLISSSSSVLGWPFLEDYDPKDEKWGCYVKKFILFERSEFMNFSSAPIFQVVRKNWPSPFGYFIMTMTKVTRALDLPYVLIFSNSKDCFIASTRTSASTWRGLTETSISAYSTSASIQDGR